MRYHLFKVSKSRNLLISDSQGKRLDIANFNVLSLPGAKIEHVYNFNPKKDFYDIIILFIGCNNLFVTTSENLVRQISDIANLLLTKAKNGFRDWNTFTQLSTSSSRKSKFFTSFLSGRLEIQRNF